MNAIFQALAYVPSVREYSEEHYERLNEKTKKVVGLFNAMYTGKYNVMVMGKIVRNFETSDPVTFLKYELHRKLDEGFFEGFSIVKVSLLAWKTIEAAITSL